LLGKKWAIIVLILDALKGFFPVRLLAPMVAPEQTALAMTFMAAGCVLGHVWTPYAGFRGGKGVATAAGAWMALSTFAFAIVAAIWLLSFVVTRIVSISSLLAVVALPVVVAMIDSPSAPAFVFAVATALFIVYTHRGNLKRLRSGQEKPLV
jgi:glycerol-3-phosphate acyltransferase PlsY